MTAQHPDQESLGERVRRIRMDAGMTVRALAKGSGVSPSFISDIENDTRRPSEATAARIATTLGIGERHINECFIGREAAEELSKDVPLVRAIRRAMTNPRVRSLVLRATE